MFERRSALPVTLATGGRDGSDGRRALKVGEVRDFTLLQVAALPGALPSLSVAVQALLGELPSSLCKAATARRRLLFKTGPEQYWVVSSADEEVTGQLQSVVAPEIGAVTSLSHSRTRLFIEGPAARPLLDGHRPRPASRQLSRRRFRPDRSPPHSGPPPSCCAGSLRALRAAHVRRVGMERLTDAALPFGYEVIFSAESDVKAISSILEAIGNTPLLELAESPRDSRDEYSSSSII